MGLPAYAFRLFISGVAVAGVKEANLRPAPFSAIRCLPLCRVGGGIESYPHPSMLSSLRQVNSV